MVLAPSCDGGVHLEHDYDMLMIMMTVVVTVVV